MPLLREFFPRHGRGERRLIAHIQVLEKAPEQFQVRNDFVRGEGAEVIVRHHFEMRFHFLGKFGAEILRHARLQLFALDLRLLVKRFLVGEILRRRMIERPDQRLFPITPRVGAGALAIGKREQHERIEIRLIAHDPRELNRGFGIVEVPLLRHV